MLHLLCYICYETLKKKTIVRVLARPRTQFLLLGFPSRLCNSLHYYLGYSGQIVLIFLIDTCLFFLHFYTLKNTIILKNDKCHPQPMGSLGTLDTLLDKQSEYMTLVLRTHLTSPITLNLQQYRFTIKSMVKWREDTVLFIALASHKSEAIECPTLE